MPLALPTACTLCNSPLPPSALEHPPVLPGCLQGRPDAKLAKAGKKVVMRYVGKLKSNGKIFDQTKGAATFSFRLGVGEVIKGGWLAGRCL